MISTLLSHVSRALRLSVIILTPVILSLASGSRPTSAATGDVLQNVEAPPSVSLSGRGIAFDGDHLYYTARDDTRIFKLDANANQVGSPIQTNPPIAFRALTWDGGQLWGRTAGTSGEAFYTIDRVTGSAALRFEISLAGTPSTCSSALAGLAYDVNTGTLWASSTSNNITVFNLSTGGAIIRSFDAPAVDCGTAVSTNGDDLWVFLCGSPCTVTQTNKRFQNYSFTGSQLPGVFGPLVDPWDQRGSSTRTPNSTRLALLLNAQCGQLQRDRPVSLPES